MAYTTPDQVKLVAAGDTNAAGPDTPASLPEEALLQAIETAAARIDARLGSRYAVPFEPVPALIREVTTDLAVFYATLTARRGAPVDPDDPARLRYADAISTLAQLANGEMVVDGELPAGSTGTVMGIDPYYGNLWTAEDFHLGYEYPTRRGYA